MKKLHLLIIKSFIGPLILTFFIAEFVLIMQFLWLYVSDLVGKGLEFSIVIKFLFYSSANLVKMALPLAILLSSVMTFGNLSENYELSAIKSAGISLVRLMSPLLIVSLILSAGLFYFSNNIIPPLNLKMRALYYDISNKQPEMLIKPGVFNEGLEDFRIKIRSKNQNTNMMYGFMVYNHKEKRGNPKVTLADSGTIELTPNLMYMVITLFGGKTYEEVNEEDNAKRIRPEHHTYFSKEIITLELSDTAFGKTPIRLFEHDYHAKNLHELERAKDSLSAGLYMIKKKFDNELKNNRYFKYQRKTHFKNDSSFLENEFTLASVEPEKLEIVVDTDSLFESSKLAEKEKILSRALEYAINNQKFIDTNKKNIERRQKNIYQHEIAWHEKFTLPLACLIFLFVGAPLGAIIRKGGFGLPFLVSIVFFLIYYIVSIMGKKFVEEGVLPTWQGMWLSSLLTLPLGIFFTYKATTDSALFDINSYLALFKWTLRVFKKRLKLIESSS